MGQELSALSQEKPVLKAPRKKCFLQAVWASRAHPQEVPLRGKCVLDELSKSNNQGQHHNATNLFRVRLKEHQYLMSKLHHQQKPHHQTKQLLMHPPDITGHLQLDLKH